MLAVELNSDVGSISLDVAFEAAAGETLALAGPSGCGKTTILRMIAGLARPREGRVSLDGRAWLDTATGADLPPEERRCGFVFQDYALFGHLDVWRNVAFGLTNLPRARRRAAATELLERFGVAELADARPATLSGGERQRVALARALAHRPDVLLLDEPLSALDVSTRAHAGRELAGTLHELGVPAILVTHDFLEAALGADRIAVIDAGRIVQTGPADALAAEPATPFVADFTGANVLRGVASRRGDGLTQVALDGGGTVVSTDPGEGEVAVGVHPWDVTIEPTGTPGSGSARNRLAVEVTTVTTVGNRVRIGLASPQPIVAEVTAEAVESLSLRPGARVDASWKAAATRVLRV